MNKILRFGLWVIVLNLFVGVSEAGAQADVIGTVLRRMDNHNKSIVSLKADLTMTKYDSVLQLTDPPMIGSTKYLPKSKITRNKFYARIDWTKPVVEQVSVIGDEYKLYRPRIPQVIAGSTRSAKGGSKAGSVLGFMTMSREELRANYSVVYLGEESVGVDVMWHLQLTPKIAGGYKTAELWIDSDGMPRKVKITERNNDTTTLLLTNIEKNITIDTKIFELNYPKSLKPIPG
jgi:outer membrane lipoprotein-sorting protein